MNKLKFLNPIGIKSDNFSTVRLGTKWAERTKPEEGSTVTAVELTDAEGGVLGTAVVKGCWVGPLAQLPALLLECSHDPVCRTWSGVAQILSGIYEEPMNYETVVTVLQLSYTGSIIKTQPLILP